MGHLSPEELEEVRAFVRQRVRGFGALDEVPEDAGEYFEGSVELPEGLVQRVLTEEIRALERDEATWPARTDNDRLDDAFAALRSAGILAEQDYWCCQTCGHHAAAEEVAGSEGRLRGYVFYHQQDTESAVDGGGLHLAFGTGGDDADADVAVAAEAVAALRDGGLEVAWNGTVRTRPHVALTWQKRRFTRAQ